MGQWSEGYCQANGIEIHYLRTGGGKPSVVCLHGFTDDGACWTPLARELEAEWDVIMPDARAHGLSSVPSSGYDTQELAADVIGLIEALRLGRPILVGHSMGGITAAVVAKERPDLVRGLVLEDPAFVSRGGEQDVEREEARRARGREWLENHKKLLETPLEQVIAARLEETPHWSREVVELWARSKHLTKLEAFALLEKGLPDYREVVTGIECPTLVVMGEVERGGIVSETMADELRALNPKVRCEKVAGAGHCVRYDRPEEFAALAKAFLRSLS
ncbi:MAG TPA: alpha/beta hydrolase [Limnochordia bacterium]|nr:alpha/beta hydrolase [Limnochordia bacterium]